MAPNQRHPDKSLVAAWVPTDLKVELVAKAAAEDVTLTEAVTQALQEWLQKPPRGTMEQAPR